MKKTVIIIAGLLSTVLFSSCLKYYPCTCTATLNGKYIRVDAGPLQGSEKHVKNECKHDVRAKYEANGFQDVECHVPE